MKTVLMTHKRHSACCSLSYVEWLAVLLEREASLRRDKRLATRLRYTKLRQQACVEDFDYRTPRGLDRALFARLAEGARQCRRPPGYRGQKW
jgi:DNA replication protein DnaC